MSIPHDCECSECEDLRAELARLQAEPMHKLLSRMKERAEKAEALLAKCGEALREYMHMHPTCSAYEKGFAALALIPEQEGRYGHGPDCCCNGCYSHKVVKKSSEQEKKI